LLTRFQETLLTCCITSLKIILKFQLNYNHFIPLCSHFSIVSSIIKLWEICLDLIRFLTIINNYSLRSNPFIVNESLQPKAWIINGIHNITTQSTIDCIYRIQMRIHYKGADYKGGFTINGLIINVDSL